MVGPLAKMESTGGRECLRIGQRHQMSSVEDLLRLKCLQRILMGGTVRNWIFRLSPERILGDRDL